jgi:excisionase family DNA binding protein
MTVRQVAEYLNVVPKVIYRLAQTGSLPGFKVAGTWRFKRQDIDDWIEQQKQRATTAPTERSKGLVTQAEKLNLEKKGI